MDKKFGVIVVGGQNASLALDRVRNTGHFGCAGVDLYHQDAKEAV